MLAVEALGAQHVADHLRERGQLSGLVPAGAPKWVTPELMADTISTWQPYYPTQLTPEQALAVVLRAALLSPPLCVSALHPFTVLEQGTESGVHLCETRPVCLIDPAVSKRMQKKCVEEQWCGK